jgi:hypothetical protein
MNHRIVCSSVEPSRVVGLDGLPLAVAPGLLHPELGELAGHCGAACGQDDTDGGLPFSSSGSRR